MSAGLQAELLANPKVQAIIREQGEAALKDAKVQAMILDEAKKKGPEYAAAAQQQVSAMANDPKLRAQAGQLVEQQKSALMGFAMPWAQKAQVAAGNAQVQAAAGAQQAQARVAAEQQKPGGLFGGMFSSAQKEQAAAGAQQAQAAAGGALQSAQAQAVARAQQAQAAAGGAMSEVQARTAAEQQKAAAGGGFFGGGFLGGMFATKSPEQVALERYVEVVMQMDADLNQWKAGDLLPQDAIAKVDEAMQEIRGIGAVDAVDASDLFEARGHTKEKRGLTASLYQELLVAVGRARKRGMTDEIIPQWLRCGC